MSFAMDRDIDKCLKVLRGGGVILYPTDTVWGLGCDATNEKAVSNIFEIKKRAGSKSLIMLVKDDMMLNRFIPDVPSQAWELIETSEEPMTIIYDKASPSIAKNCLADDGSVGVRIVKDEFCKTLIHKFGKPIISSSANISGEDAPALFDEIDAEIKNKADHVVEWGQDDYKEAKPSTIIKLSNNGVFKIIRR